MSDVLWGVLLGGCIGTIGTLVTAWYSDKQHKKDRLIKYHIEKRDKQVQINNHIIDGVVESFDEDNPMTELNATKIGAQTYGLPSGAIDELGEWLISDRTESSLNKMVINIIIACEKDIKDMDRKIEELLND